MFRILINEVKGEACSLKTTACFFAFTKACLSTWPTERMARWFSVRAEPGLSRGFFGGGFVLSYSLIVQVWIERNMF